MKKKTVSLLLVAAMAVGMLAGCGGGKSSISQDGSSDAAEGNEKAEMADAKDVDGTTITFWHSMGGVNGQAIDTLVKKFNDENEYGITVEAQYQGEYDDSLNKLKSAQIGNMGADLVQVYEIGTRFMIESGWTVPMQEMIDADNYDVSEIEPNLAAYYTIDNQLYSMPFNSSTPIMYYNKDMFDKAGITEIPDSLEAIDEIGDQLMSKGGAEEVMSLGIYGWFFEQFIGKQGLDYANNGNGREKAAIAVDFDKNGAAKNILTAWQKLKVSSSDEGGVSIGGASLWALNNKDPKKLRATWEFVKFLISPESQAYWNAQTGYFPVTTKAHDEQTFKDNIAQYPQFQTAIDQLHDSSPEYCGALLSVFPEARATVESEIESMLNGKEDVDTAVQKMSDSINKAITDYNTVNN